MLTLFLDRNQQRRDGQVWLMHIQTDQAIVLSNRLDARKRPPDVGRDAVRIAAYLKFHHVVPAQAFDQIGRRAFGNHLSVIDDGQAITQTLGFVHVVRREQHRASSLLETANRVPKLAAALRIQPSCGLVQKKNLGITYQRGRDCEPLALAARKLAYPGICFLGELHLLEHFERCTRLPIETRKQLDGFKDSQFFR